MKKIKIEFKGNLLHMIEMIKNERINETKKIKLNEEKEKEKIRLNARD
jgi:hypothetical protein